MELTSAIADADYDLDLKKKTTLQTVSNGFKLISSFRVVALGRQELNSGVSGTWLF